MKEGYYKGFTFKNQDALSRAIANAFHCDDDGAYTEYCALCEYAKVLVSEGLIRIGCFAVQIDIDSIVVVDYCDDDVLARHSQRVAP